MNDSNQENNVVQMQPVPIADQLQAQLNQQVLMTQAIAQQRDGFANHVAQLQVQLSIAHQQISQLKNATTSTQPSAAS